ncbi:hypothetical protein D047_2973B, partial [Vibrio parahaemolyticus VPTS-2010_2]
EFTRCSFVSLQT